MATHKIVNYYAAVFLLRSPFLLCLGHHYSELKRCQAQEMASAKGRRDNNSLGVVNLLRVVNLLHVAFLV